MAEKLAGNGNWGRMLSRGAGRFGGAREEDESFWAAEVVGPYGA